MTQLLALLAFFIVPSTFAQTTFVTHRESGHRTEVLLTGQGSEGALRDLLFLAEMRAHPGKLVEGRESGFDLGRITKIGEGIRLGLASDDGEAFVHRGPGSVAVIELRDGLGWALYGLMSTAGWHNRDLGLYYLTSPSGAISCDMEWRTVEWVQCTIHLDHVQQ